MYLLYKQIFLPRETVSFWTRKYHRTYAFDSRRVNGGVFNKKNKITRASASNNFQTELQRPGVVWADTAVFAFSRF